MMDAMPTWTVTIVPLSALILLATEKISVDRTALGILVALMLSGVLTPSEAIAGFSSPAVITVAALFIVSEGMIRSGVVGSIVQKVIALSRGNRKAALGISMMLVATASAFINNTPVVVLFIPHIWPL